MFNRRFGACRLAMSGGVAKGALACAVFGMIPQTVLAQNGADTVAEDGNGTGEIVVTGVRAAIQKSLETKRQANSIVDSISAEDIGKFPDANIAEAVQRIPGVSIDRSGGEGRFISINGLGPEFSLTLFNGRQIATTEPGRSFAFDTIASNLISQVNVYKTANANVPEGGLGGTIDVMTARPFDNPGFHASTQAAYQFDGNSKEGFPEVSFVVSDTFMDDHLGVLLSFTHQKRHGRTYQSSTGGFSRNYFVDLVSEAYVEDANDEAWRAWQIQYGNMDTYRTRDGGTAAVQFRAADNLVLTADYLFSKFNVKNVTNTGGTYIWAVQDNADTIRDSNGVYTQLDVSRGANKGSYSFNNTIEYRPTTTQQAGLNLKWDFSDDFSAVVDGYWSKAINDNRGLNQSNVLEMLFQPPYRAYFPEDGSVPYIDTEGRDLTQHMADLRARQVGDSGTYVRAVNKGVRADFKYKLNRTFSFTYGALYGVQEKGNDNYATPQAIRRMYHANALDQVIDYDSIVANTVMAGQRFGNAKEPFPVFVIDPAALRSWMADPVNLANRTSNAAAGGLAQFIANGRTWNAVRTNSSFMVREKDFSAYADIHIDTEIAAMPLNIVAGLRFSQTELTSFGTTSVISPLVPETRADPTVPGGIRETGVLVPPDPTVAPAIPVSAQNTYQNWLPSLNVKFEPARGFILRGSVSRTMSRPTLSALGPAVTLGGLMKVQRNATANNPDLRPFTSDNLDASAEYYYGRSGSLAIAAFHKNASDFIVTTAEDEVLDVEPAIYSVFRVSRPRNLASAKITGLTASWTHTLDMGLGAQANYTKVWSSTSVTPGLSFSVPGVSDTANIVGFYEKYGFSARAALNWRSRFLVTPGVAREAEPVYSDAYHQIDARLGYDFGGGLSAGIDVINLTKQKVEQHGRYKNEFIGMYDYGRQFRFSVAKRF